MTDTPSCCICGSGAPYEINAETYVCGAYCESVWAEQFCVACGANTAEGEEHSRSCQRDYAADKELRADYEHDVWRDDRFADDSGPIVAGEFDEEVAS